MDIRVQELLEKIRREGVESAEADAVKILADAAKQSKAIVAEAEKEARAMLDAARADVARLEQSGRAALMQASRDLLLAFRTELENMLAGIVRTDSAAACTADNLGQILPALIEAWARDGRDDLTVLVPEQDLARLEAWFMERLSGQLKAGVVLRPLKGLRAGFRIVEKDGAVYYDFSAEAVADLLGAYLNSRLAAILTEAAGAVSGAASTSSPASTTGAAASTSAAAAARTPATAGNTATTGNTATAANAGNTIQPDKAVL
jgi:V/A-type H+-transporting ATPase subunit E